MKLERLETVYPKQLAAVEDTSWDQLVVERLARDSWLMQPRMKVLLLSANVSPPRVVRYRLNTRSKSEDSAKNVMGKGGSDRG